MVDSSGDRGQSDKYPDSLLAVDGNKSERLSERMFCVYSCRLSLYIKVGTLWCLLLFRYPRKHWWTTVLGLGSPASTRAVSTRG